MTPLTVISLSAAHRAQGYGSFPYVIVRMLGGVYMQFPIHFYEEKIPAKPGLRVKVDSIANEQKNYSSLFNVVRQFHQQINPNKETTHKVCLVLSPFIAYFYHEGIFEFSEEIPTGGSLINSEYHIMSMNSPHFS